MKIQQVLLAFLLAAVCTSAINPDSSSMIIQLNLSSTMHIVQSGDYALEYAIATLKLVPQTDERQQVKLLEPTAENGSMTYEWTTPGTKEFGFTSLVKTKTALTVADHIPFPAESSPSEYTLPGKNIDSDNPDIIRLASELAKGDDDLFSVALKLGRWTHDNIEYNLSTIGLPVNKTASWVLKTRQGVCAEISTLFIALNRAVGIPARQISGAAYSGSENIWGAHAWAELYFPGYGWVPYDVTFGTYGYVDSTHISLRKSPDSDNTAVHYTWKGRNIELQTGDIKLTAAVEGEESPANQNVEITAEPVENPVGFGSYNAIALHLQNLDSYYKAITIQPSQTEFVTLDAKPITIMLKPMEEHDELLILKVSDQLSRRFIYTFPIHFTTQAGNLTVRFAAQAGSSIYSRDDFAQPQPVERQGLGRLDLTCKPGKEFYYSYEKIMINCSARNSGNLYLENLSICAAYCVSTDLGINQRRDFSFEGNQTRITASNPIVSTADIVRLRLLGIPTISITADAPAEVKYGPQFNLTIQLLSDSMPANLTVSVSHRRKLQEYSIENLTEYTIIVETSADDFKQGNNTYKVHAAYYDLNGREYTADREVVINLQSPSFRERILMIINDILGFLG